MGDFFQSKKGKVTIGVIIVLLVLLITILLLVKGPNDTDKPTGSNVNIGKEEGDREVIQKDDTVVEEESESGLIVVQPEDADVDGSDFAEFPEVDEDGNVIPSDDKDDDKDDDKADDDKDDDKADDGKDDDKTDDGKDDDKDDDKTDDDKDDDDKDPTGTWGPFF